MYVSKIGHILLKFGGPEEDRWVSDELPRRSLGAFATDSASQLDVLGHDGDSLGVDGAEVGVFEESDEVGLAGFLESHDGSSGSGDPS